MHLHELTLPDFRDTVLGSPDDLVDLEGSLVVVHGDAATVVDAGDAVLEAVALLPVVVVAAAADATSPRAPWTAPFDLVLNAGDPGVEAVAATVAANPHAATAMAQLLRASEPRSVAEGLFAESAVYSMLQGGPEFEAWRRATPVRERAADVSPRVRVTRAAGRLDVLLDRPDVRNALDARMRDELCEALALVGGDPTIIEVHLAGEGESFCSGGDLDEFGSRPDPATAHLVRTGRSVASALAGVADRVTAHLHGACVGSGIELPAFAHRVVAERSTRIALPEVSLGLVPGAGGTVSLPRRIGRHRTAQLALTGEVVDAETALAWGLVDELVD